MSKSKIGLLIAGLAAFSGLTIATVSAAPSSDTPSGPAASGVKDLPTAVPATTGGGTAATTVPPTVPPQRSAQIIVPPAQISAATTTKKRNSGPGSVLPSMALEPGGSEVPEVPWSP